MPAPPPSLTVREVSQQRESLDGKVVRVRGIVHSCQRLSCALVSLPNEHHYISIGSSEAFDRDIRRALNREVVVEGTVKQRCIHDFDNAVLALCTDRPDSLASPVLVWPKIR